MESIDEILRNNKINESNYSELLDMEKEYKESLIDFNEL